MIGFAPATKEIVAQTNADTLAERAASPAGGLVALLVELIAGEGRKAIPLAELTALYVERRRLKSTLRVWCGLLHLAHDPIAHVAAASIRTMLAGA